MAHASAGFFWAEQVLLACGMSFRFLDNIIAELGAASGGFFSAAFEDCGISAGIEFWVGDAWMIVDQAIRVFSAVLRR